MNTKQNLIQAFTYPVLTTAVLLMIPLIAMQFSEEVVWTLSDFIFAGLLIFGTGFTYKLITLTSEDNFYRLAVGFALFTGLFLIWVNGAVGIIGSETNPINILYYIVIFIGITGAFIARFRPSGMVLTMTGMAVGQAALAAIAIIGGHYQSPPSSVFEILAVNGFFIMLFVIAALLFQNAGRHLIQKS